MSGIWFTADPHFRHKLVSGLRGFATPEEHDDEFCAVWRSQVKPGDQVWVLGDLLVTNSKLSEVLDIVRSLPGIKHLVLGNHDAGHPMHSKAHLVQAQYFETFTTVQSAGTIRINRKKILLSHFPYPGTDHTETSRYDQWRLPDMGGVLLHGHTHSTVRRTSEREIHVGWDAWRRLVSLAEISKMLGVEGE